MMPLTVSMLRSNQLVEKTVRGTRAAGTQKSYSEEKITPELSLTVSAVLAAFTILSEDISSLPLILYERQGRNKFRATDSQYYRLLHDQPNPEHSSMVFRELMIGHLLGWGNFFGQPIFDKRGDVQEIWPLRPDRMRVERVNGERIYYYQTTDGKPRIFLNEEILHIPAFGFDGLIGYSRIALARNAIGLSISTEKFGSKFFSNGATPGIIYKHPSQLSDKAFERLNDSLEKKKGVEQSHQPIILEEGMGIEKLGIPPDDAQFLETRKFQVSEIARIFRVPPHMIGDVEKSTSWGSGIDSQEQGYVNHTIRPWATRIEQELNLRILPPADRASFFYEHLMDGLLRGDIAVRYQAYIGAITNGIMSRNEVRVRENMNPRKGLDAILMPLNMTTVDDGSSANSNGATSSATNALDPLWRDAIGRVLKRETNDVLGASKRWQAKGQTDTYDRWVESFYRKDHLAFVQKQLKPVLDAQMRLFAVDISERLDLFMLEFLTDRIEQSKQITYEQLLDTLDKYIETATNQFMTFIHECVEDALTVGEEMELVYE
jgi:HK97 family phage portal protein